MTEIAISSSCQKAGRPIGTRLRNLLNLARQRRALAKLDDHALNDIGITRTEAETEAGRPLWDAPDSWHKQLY